VRNGLMYCLRTKYVHEIIMDSEKDEPKFNVSGAEDKEVE
jgi:hypothetical protein